MTSQAFHYWVALRPQHIFLILVYDLTVDNIFTTLLVVNSKA